MWISGDEAPIPYSSICWRSAPNTDTMTEWYCWSGTDNKCQSPAATVPQHRPGPSWRFLTGTQEFRKDGRSLNLLVFSPHMGSGASLKRLKRLLREWFVILQDLVSEFDPMPSKYRSRYHQYLYNTVASELRGICHQVSKSELILITWHFSWIESTCPPHSVLLHSELFVCLLFVLVGIIETL